MNRFFVSCIATSVLGASMMMAQTQSSTAAKKPAVKQPASAAAKPAAKSAPADTSEAALRARAQAYYDAVLKNDRPKAVQYLTPESKESLSFMNYQQLMAAKVSNVEVAADGKTAIVTMSRRQQVPMVQYMDVEMKDNWTVSNGQWRLMLPNARVSETPFGPMKRDTSIDPASILESRKKSADPDQIYKAIDKVDREQREKPATTTPATRPQSTTPTTATPQSDAGSTKPPQK